MSDLKTKEGSCGLPAQSESITERVVKIEIEIAPTAICPDYTNELLQDTKCRRRQPARQRRPPVSLSKRSQDIITNGDEEMEKTGETSHVPLGYLFTHAMLQDPSVEEKHQDIFKDRIKTVRKSRRYDRPPVVCSLCRKTFVSQRNLSRHMNIHTKQVAFECTLCQKRTYDKSNLLAHMKTHTGETPYECSVCAKKFTQRGSLSVHMRIHTGQTPYVCTVCNKKFAARSNWTGHMRTHTGETPYKCSVCSKQFAHQSHMRAHMRSHTGETPYECSVCNKRFTLSGHLLRHTKTHNNTTPYHCQECDQGWSTRKQLSEHTLQHKEKPLSKT